MSFYGGGTITGYASDAVNGNVVKDRDGAAQGDRGHAVYAVYAYAAADSVTKRRETTAGTGMNLSWNSIVYPPTFSGGWED